MLGFSRPKKETLHAVAHIESGSAGVALVSSDTEVRIVAYEHAELSPTHRPKDSHTRALLRILDESIHRLQSDASRKGIPIQSVASLYVLIGAPWSHSQTVHAQSRFDTETRIEKSIITKLSEEALDSVSTLNTENLVESSIVRVALNGYPAEHPVGKRARSVEVTVFASDCDPDIKQGATQAFSRHFGDREVRIRSSARAFLALCNEMPQHPDNYVAVVFGASASDAFVVRDGIITSRVSISIGINELLSHLSTELPEESRTLLHLISTGATTARASSHVHGNFARAQARFVSACMQAFESLTSDEKLPPEILIVAPPEISPLLGTIFTRHDFRRFAHAAQPFSIHHVLQSRSSESSAYAQDIYAKASAALIRSEQHLSV